MRTLTYEMKNDWLIVYIERDIDHHGAQALRAEIDRLIDENNPARLVLDFDAVAFMDSSGIGLILGRYKKMKALGRSVCVQSLNARCRRLVELSGVLEIVTLLEGETKP